MNTTWAAGCVPPPSGARAPRACCDWRRERLSVKWRREVLVVPTRLLLIRRRRGGGSNEREVPAVRAGLLRSRHSRATMPWACRGWATRVRAIPRGGCVGAGSTGYAPAYVQIPATRLATPAREFAHFSSFFFFSFFFFKHWTYWYALHTPGLRPRCAGCTGMRAAYTRTASPQCWMRWHALACTRTASCADFFFFLNRHAHAPCRICCIGCTWHARIHQDCIGTLPGALACACIHQDCILTLPLLDALVRV